MLSACPPCCRPQAPCRAARGGLVPHVRPGPRLGLAPGIMAESPCRPVKAIAMAPASTVVTSKSARPHPLAPPASRLASCSCGPSWITPLPALFTGPSRGSTAERPRSHPTELTGKPCFFRVLATPRPTGVHAGLSPGWRASLAGMARACGASRAPPRLSCGCGRRAVGVGFSTWSSTSACAASRSGARKRN